MTGQAGGTNDNRRAPIAIPRGGFRTNEEEARWLEQTLIMRMQEATAALGISTKPEPRGLYELLLHSLNAASKRARGRPHA